jgi:Flp pilus assembly protein TadG
MMLRRPRSRRGAVLVESAFVFPVAIFLILALVIGGMGIFRYQEAAAVAREAARYASVHGTAYQADKGKPAATAQDIYNNAILPRLVTLDPGKLSYSVTWNQTNSPSSVTTNYSQPTGNTVSVTITYQWLPELFLIGPITLSSTSTLPMSY